MAKRRDWRSSLVLAMCQFAPLFFFALAALCQIEYARQHWSAGDESWISQARVVIVLNFKLTSFYMLDF